MLVTAARLSVALGVTVSAVSLLLMNFFLDTFIVVAFVTSPLPGVLSGSVLFLCTLWVQKQRCVTYVNRAINMMIPGKQGTYRECLADRPLSIRAIRCMNHASTAEFAGAGVMGPMAAVGYSEFIVGPCWIMAYEAMLAVPAAPGLSRSSRACIAAIANQNSGCDLMYAWYKARYDHLKEIAASSADTVRDAYDLLPALETRLRNGGTSSVVFLKRVAASIDPIRRAHLVATAMASSFFSRVGKCFCDWPWAPWTPLGRLHKIIFTQVTAREALQATNFEGVSFAAMTPTDAAFRTADREDELRVEELPPSVVSALAPLPAIHRAVAAWYRCMVRCSRQALRVETRDVFQNFINGQSIAWVDDGVGLPQLGTSSNATPHATDRSALFFAMIVAVSPRELKHAHLMAVLHEKSALGALHAACYGAAEAAVRIGRLLSESS